MFEKKNFSTAYFNINSNKYFYCILKAEFNFY